MRNIKRNLSRFEGDLKKRISKGLQPPFFHTSNMEISSLGNAENRGKTNCKKCLLVKFRRWNAEKSPQIPAVRGFSADAGERASTLVTVLVRRK